MPRCLMPGATIRIVLDSDQDKPAETQPVFLFRALPMREWRAEIDRMTNTPIAELGPTKAEMGLVLVKKALVGWENMVDHKTDPPTPIPFSVDNLTLLVDEGEGVELFEKLTDVTRLSAADKKKLDSRSSSSTEPSAPAAPQESA